MILNESQVIVVYLTILIDWILLSLLQELTRILTCVQLIIVNHHIIGVTVKRALKLLLNVRIKIISL